MAKETFSFVSEDVQRYEKFMFQIQNGLLTGSDFTALSDEEKAVAKEVLFDLYTKDNINIYASLSAIEFCLMGLAKLFFSLVPNQPQATPNPDMDAFYAQLKSIIDHHDMPMEPNTWQLNYFAYNLLKVLANREEYKQEKVNLTGSF